MKLYLVMIVAAVIMIYGNKKSKEGIVWGRPLAGLFGIIAVICALMQIWLVTTGSSREQKGIMERQKQYSQAQMQFLGDYVGSHFPDASILLIRSPSSTYAPEQKRQKMMHDALVKGLAGRASISSETCPEAPEPTSPAGGGPGAGPGGPKDAPPPEMMMAPEMYFTAKAFDSMIRDHDADLVISLLGLPMDCQQMKFWKKPKDQRPKLILVMNSGGEMMDIRKAIKKGFISAVIMAAPLTNPDDLKKPVPDNYKDAFHARYILADLDNIDEMVKKYPMLFMMDVPPTQKKKDK